MSKYDFELDLSQNSSTGIILSKIRKGSVVLEFGCAAGRMTRYMKESLGCQVYIVEFDQNAYKAARQYATEGLCDDILNFQWLEKFKQIRFDVILFTDVLEHLNIPEKVLSCAAGLLKDSGHIYVSIPNIFHNDILIKAYFGRFDYTPTGLLDEGHVHFWGIQNIEELAKMCGLYIKKVEGTYCPTGSTEQYAQLEHDQESILLQNLLIGRQCGEVYQLIITFVKKEAGPAEYVLRAPFIQSHVYLDTGNDFNEEELMEFPSLASNHGVYTAHCLICPTKNLKRVRFDPIEHQGCILQNICFMQGKKMLSPQYEDAIEMDNGVLLPGTDPMVYAEVEPGDGPVTIHAEIIILGGTYTAVLQKEYINRRAELKSVQEEADRLTAEIRSLTEQKAGWILENKKLDSDLEQLRSELMQERSTLERCCGILEKKNSELEELRKERDSLLKKGVEAARENEQLRTDLSAYVILTNNKEKYILTLEQKLSQKLSQKLCPSLLRYWRKIKQRFKNAGDLK